MGSASEDMANQLLSLFQFQQQMPFFSDHLPQNSSSFFPLLPPPSAAAAAAEEEDHLHYLPSSSAASTTALRSSAPSLWDVGEIRWFKNGAGAGAGDHNNIINGGGGGGGCSEMKEAQVMRVMKMKRIKARKKVREPRFCFKTMSDIDVLDDGYKWRKYGQKIVKNTLHPRSYYRCTENKCRVKKRVERLAEDPRMVITTYEGRHAHSPSRDNLEETTIPSGHLSNFFW